MLKMMDPDNLPKFVYLHNNYKYRLKLGFYAAPSNPKIFSTAVKDELKKLKFTYCPDLNGLIMGFGKINSIELIQADVRHCINVVINVDVYIFRPPIGSIIKAVVNQTSENHVSCLVHNLFNVSIVRPEHQPYNQWPGSKIKKDDKINVKVLSFDLTKKLPHITGDIVDNKYTDDELDNYSEKCSSSTKELVSGFTKSIEHIEKRDTDSSSKLLSSDSESFDEVAGPITRSKTFENQLTKTSLLNQTTNHNDKHIEGPLFSSTPVSTSEHSVNNINLIRNKQLKQLHKHLAKNAEKEKSLDYVQSKIKLNLPATSIISNDNSGSTNKINRQRSLQSDSGISDDDRKQINFPIQNAFSNTPGTSTKTIEKHQNSDKIVGSILHSTSQNNEIKHETNVSKHNLLFDFNTDRTSDDDDDDEEKSVYTQHINNIINSDEENSVYTQHIHDLKNSDEENSVYTQHIHDLKNSDEENSVYTQHIHNLKNSDEEMLLNCKSTNEATNKEPTTLNTRSIKKSNVYQNKYLKDCGNKTVKEHSNKSLSLMSDSEDSSENEKLPIKEINHQNNLNNKIEKNTIDISSRSKVDIINIQYIGSSDDEVYKKPKQNISKMDDTKPLTEQTKSQQILSDDDENNSNINCHNNISTIIKMLEDTDGCNLNNSNILLEIKKLCKKLNKTNSTLETLKYSNNEKKSSPNLFIENNNQNEIIRHNIETTSSDNDVDSIVSNETLKKEKALNVNETLSTLESSTCSNKKNNVTPNVNSEKNKKNEYIGHNLEEDTSNDDEVNLLFNKNISKKSKHVKTNTKHETLKCSNDEKKSSPNLFIKNNNQNEIIRHNIEATSSDNDVDSILSNETLKKEKAINLHETLSTHESSMCCNKKKNVTPNLNSKKNKKNEKIGHNVEDSSSDDEMNIALSKKMSTKLKQVNEKESTLKSSLYSNIKKKVTPNLISEKNKKNDYIGHNLEEDTSNDDEVNSLFNKNISKKSKHVKTNTKHETLKCSNDEKKSSPNLLIKNNNKNEIIGHNIEATSSDNDVDSILSNETLKKEKAINLNETLSTLESSTCSNKKKNATPNLNSKKNKKNEKIGHNVEEDSSSDDEMNIALSKKMSTKLKQVNEKESTLKSSLYSNMKKKVIPNLISEKNKKNEYIGHNLVEETSNDDEVNLLFNKNISKKSKHIKTNTKHETLKCSNDEKISSPNLFIKNNNHEVIEHNIEAISSDNEVDLILSNEKSSILKSSIGSNKKKKLTPNLSNEKNKKNEIIKHILKDDSSCNDKIKCTSLKSNNTDEYKIKTQQKSNRIPTSVLNLNKNTCTVLKKDIFNPFIKLYTHNLTNSSSDDETFINLTKSKDIINHSSKKKCSSLIKDRNKKEDIIKEVLTSLKHKNKKQKLHLPVKHTNLSSKNNDSLVKIKKFKKEESIVSTKNKKAVLDKLNNPIDELKPNTLSQNIYLKDSQLQLKLNPTNDSTDDEIDVIKKILGNKQKLNKINNKKIELPELSIKNDIASKSNNLSEISEKLNKKPKSERASTAVTNELINNIIKIKKKRPKETKDLILDNIMNSLDDSSNSHVQFKKKKKDHNTTIKTDDVSKDTMFYGDLSKDKKKKIKNKHNEDITLNDLAVQDNKNQYNSSIKFEQQNTPMQKDTFMNITKKNEKKKKVKSDPIQLDTQNTTTDKSKLNDKLANKYIAKCQERKGSNKKNLKLLTKNQIKTFLLSQNTNALDNLYTNLSSIK